MQSIDLSGLIQRDLELEQRYGIALEGLFAHEARDLDPDMLDATITVNGEVRALAPHGLPANLRLMASAHDEQGRTLLVLTTEVARDGFASLQAFSMHEYNTVLPRIPIAAVKLYPQGV